MGLTASIVEVRKASTAPVARQLTINIPEVRRRGSFSSEGRYVVKEEPYIRKQVTWVVEGGIVVKTMKTPAFVRAARFKLLAGAIVELHSDLQGKLKL